MVGIQYTLFEIVCYLEKKKRAIVQISKDKCLMNYPSANQESIMFFKISPLPDKLSFRLKIIYQIISDNLKKEIPFFKYIIIVKKYQLVNGYSLNMP